MNRLGGIGDYTMNTVDFAYWLQGFYELSDTSEGITAKQAEIIQQHLHLVFLHCIDPVRDEESNATPQEMNAVHQRPPVKPSTPSSLSASSWHTNNDPLIRC